MAAALNCPICRKEVAPDSPEMPFCSARCRLIDLGNWASDKYVIPAGQLPENTRDGELDEADEGQ